MTVLKRLARARRAFFRDETIAPVRAGRPASEYFFLTPDLALLRLANGHLLYVDPQDETMSAHLIGYGYWEPNVYAVVTSLISPGDVVLEVGANVGYYTVAMGRIVGSAGHVHSFEANARLAGMVERSAYINGLKDWVRVHPKAAMDQPGVVRFERSRKRSGWGHVTQWQDTAFDDSEIVEVEATTMDAQGLSRVDLIRLDAEGSEPLILRGAADILSANPQIAICMEWDPVQMRARADLTVFVAWLAELGFHFWRIGTDARLTEIPMQAAVDLDVCDVVISRRFPQKRS